MARELLTTWTDYRSALERVLELAQNSLQIYGGDLRELKLESSNHLAHLQRIATQTPRESIQIALRNAQAIRREHPRLLDLLRTYGHAIHIHETADTLSHLRDTMILVDGKHGLIRFHEDQPRSKLLIDEAEEVLPYRKRFQEIWAEPGDEITGTTLGL